MSDPILTAADPEPPPWTIVRDDTGCQWVRQPGRVPCGWISEHDTAAVDPESWAKVAGNYGPVTVLFTPPVDALEAKPQQPKPDLATQIRERLDELAAPPLPPQFLAAPDGASPEEITSWQEAFDELTAGAPVHRVVMLPLGATWEPFPDPRNAALLAVVELHAPIDGAAHVCAERIEGEEHFRATEHVTVHAATCPTLRAIAAKLGIEVDHG